MGEALNIIACTALDDPRLRDYTNIKDRQWAEDFLPGGGTSDAPLGKFMCEGEVVLAHAVRSKYKVLSVLATPTRLTACADDLALLPPGTPIYQVELAQMEKLVGFSMHRGLLAIAARAPLEPIDAFIAQMATRPGPIVLLEDLCNHDNIGAIFRNASCLGASGVILSARCADPLYRKAVRVSVGHILRLPWTIAPDWSGLLVKLQASGMRLAALDPGPGSIDIQTLPASEELGRLALILGTEGPGVQPQTLERVDLRLRIAMVPGVDSLNVAVTSGIALHRLGRTGTLPG
jgi:tRNA G18 (ribose-2'-O)-methylase SpoU